MSFLARAVLSWTLVSVVVSPLVGTLLHRQAPRTVPQPVR